MGTQGLVHRQPDINRRQVPQKRKKKKLWPRQKQIKIKARSFRRDGDKSSQTRSTRQKLGHYSHHIILIAWQRRLRPAVSLTENFVRDLTNTVWGGKHKLSSPHITSLQQAPSSPDIGPIWQEGKPVKRPCANMRVTYIRVWHAISWPCQRWNIPIPWTCLRWRKWG